MNLHVKIKAVNQRKHYAHIFGGYPCNCVSSISSEQQEQKRIALDVEATDHYMDANREMNPSRWNRQLSLQISGNGGVEKRDLRRNGRSFGRQESMKGDFSLFRTRSSLSRQVSMLPERRDGDVELNERDGGGRGEESPVDESVPPSAGRYFAALRGPELDQVRESEDILLPKDEVWPFLLRFPINSYGICLGLGSQSVLWSALSSSSAFSPFLHSISHLPHTLLWLFALASLLSISTLYLLKSAFFFEAVRREYHHPVRVNFFFAPFVASVFLSLSLPTSFFGHGNSPHPALFIVFVLPILALELKIYGQWLSGGQRRLCKVANPSTHLSIVGNFVGAIFAARIHWYEPAKFLWAVGFAHYLVVFVTLYQRLPTNETLPKELHPVYSMFIAAPSAASIAWEGIYGEFDEVSRTCYFMALFLYTLLVVRINFFRGFRFSVAWWAYSFPMTTVSLATLRYTEAVPCTATRALALVLAGVSSATVGVLLMSTLLHGLYWRSLFPNDVAIAITKGGRAWKGSRGGNGSGIKQWAHKHSPLALVSTAKGKSGSGSPEKGGVENV